MAEVNSTMGGIVHVDAVVVGAGFSGISALYRLRKLGLSAKVFEAGGDFGGVWYWNRYPGARVDSEYPYYQLNIPEAYRTWEFKERFPGHVEIREYMAHLDKTLDLRKDVEFNAPVDDAQYDKEKATWTVKTSAGHIATSKYLILATGLLHRRHYPDFPGLQDFKGVVHHSGFWPENLSVKGKRVAVIGAGATSVQIVQELAKEAEHLSMFMRRPSLCLPMGQRPLSHIEQIQWKSYYEGLFAAGRKSLAGFPASRKQCSALDVPAEEREQHFEELWERGGFSFLMGTYNDILINSEANRVVYDFWAKKIRARMTDPVKRDLMAPLEPPYHIGTKRCPLEQDYYECLDMKHVDVVDMSANALKTFTTTGMEMEDGSTLDFDVVVLATGFDSFTGSLTHMGLKNKEGIDIKDLWKDGVNTYLGMLISGFPNAFIVYSPQAPTALSNGPTILECQLDFITDVIGRLEKQNAKSIEAQRPAEEGWKQLINQMNEQTLFPLTSSWWTGGNIPGKKAELLTFCAGIDVYETMCKNTLDGWKGFEVVSA